MRSEQACPEFLDLLKTFSEGQASGATPEKVSERKPLYRLIVFSGNGNDHAYAPGDFGEITE